MVFHNTQGEIVKLTAWWKWGKAAPAGRRQLGMAAVLGRTGGNAGGPGAAQPSAASPDLAAGETENDNAGAEESTGCSPAAAAEEPRSVQQDGQSRRLSRCLVRVLRATAMRGIRVGDSETAARGAWDKAGRHSSTVPVEGHPSVTHGIHLVGLPALWRALPVLCPVPRWPGWAHAAGPSHGLHGLRLLRPLPAPGPGKPARRAL